MSDGPDKPALPAWQQAAQSTSAEAVKSTTNTERKETSDNTDATSTTPDLAAAVTSPPFKDDDSEQSQREQIRAFLDDSAVKDQSIEKKRAFLKSKDMPIHLIDEELGAQSSEISLETSDFADFRGQKVSEQPAKTQQSSVPPPIITYPEFLANAHQAPPLITPARILATTYIASATAALAYAASTFLIKPMAAALTDMRHEFAMHSIHQVDDLNSRLEKVVSSVPGAKANGKEEDSDSVASEPTELFSRDQGTQTADASAQQDGTGSKVTIVEPTATVKQAEKLQNLQKRLEDVLAGTQKEGKAIEEREENAKKVRHYLNTLSYGGSGINVWSNAGGQFGWEQTASEQQKEKEKKEDPIEELKKEIRGVKGVLLSAKRFPTAGRALPGSQYTARRGVDAPV